MAVSVTYTLEAGYGLGAVVRPARVSCSTTRWATSTASPASPTRTGLIGTAAERRASGQAHAVEHDTSDRREGRQARRDRRQSGWTHDHQYRAAGRAQPHRLSDAHPGGGERTALASPVAAGRVFRPRPTRFLPPRSRRSRRWGTRFVWVGGRARRTRCRWMGVVCAQGHRIRGTGMRGREGSRGAR